MSLIDVHGMGELARRLSAAADLLADDAARTRRALDGLAWESRAGELFRALALEAATRAGQRAGDLDEVAADLRIEGSRLDRIAGDLTAGVGGLASGVAGALTAARSIGHELASRL